MLAAAGEAVADTGLASGGGGEGAEGDAAVVVVQDFTPALAVAGGHTLGAVLAEADAVAVALAVDAQAAVGARVDLQHGAAGGCVSQPRAELADGDLLDGG